MSDELKLDVVLQPFISNTKEGALLKAIMSGQVQKLKVEIEGMAGKIDSLIGKKTTGTDRESSTKQTEKIAKAESKALKDSEKLAKKIAKAEEKLKEKHQKENVKLATQTVAILGGIVIVLNAIPSILRGVFKILNIGFLLILKPFADLLAMILLPIAKLVIEFALWLNKLAGGGMGGMLIAAVIGLIVASIGLLAIAVTGGLIATALTSLILKAIAATTLTLGGAKIATALTTLATTSIGATSLAGLLGTVLIAAAITALIVKALGGTDEDAIAASLVTVFVAGLALVFGAPFWVALGIGILAGTVAFFGGEALMKEYEKAQEVYKKGLYGPTGIPGKYSIDPISGEPVAIGVAALGGPVIGGQSYIVGEKGPELFTPSNSGNITPNNKLGGSQSVNISVSGIMDERKITDLIKSVVNQAMRESNSVRGSTGY